MASHRAPEPPPVSLEGLVWHRDWPGDRFGLAVAEYTDSRGTAYVWVVPPFSARPLTFLRESLTFLDAEDG